MPSSCPEPGPGSAPRPRALRAAAALAGLALGFYSAPAPGADAPGPAAAEASPRARPGPTAVVEGLHAALIDLMKAGPELDFEQRAARIDPVIRASYDIPYMARKAVGRYWRDLSEEERRRLVDLFTRLSVANYAARFTDYSEQRFDTVGEEPSSRGTVLVKTVLVNGDERVELNYRLRPGTDGWKIIDVFLQGTVSELAMRRAEYTSVIKREGFPALLEAIEERIARYARGEVPKAG